MVVVLLWLAVLVTLAKVLVAVGTVEWDALTAAVAAAILAEWRLLCD